MFVDEHRCRDGHAPNIVPALSETTYMVQATSTEELAEVRERVERCFEAGALATGCQLELAPRRRAYAPMRTNAFGNRSSTRPRRAPRPLGEEEQPTRRPSGA